jgi:serine/threonine-protein kinase HipA
MQGMKLSPEDVDQQFRRMLFNVVARNQDDHVKNIAFIMNKAGEWSLSPAFDISFSYNPDGMWTSKHQMSINGKRDQFVQADFEACAQVALLKRGRAKTLLQEVQAAVARWPDFAEQAGVSEYWMNRIQSYFRIEIPQV